MKDEFELFNEPGTVPKIESNVVKNEYKERIPRIRIDAEGTGLLVITAAKFIFVLLALFNLISGVLLFFSYSNSLSFFFDSSTLIALLIVIAYLIIAIVFDWIIYVIVKGFGELINNSELLIRLKERDL